VIGNALRTISLQQLEALSLLVAEGSFSRAARKMNLSQPSLTKHIRNMEDTLQAAVVNREKGGVTLTPEGRVVYDYARRLLKLRGDTEDKIARLRENEAGTVAVAASTIPATYFLPTLLGRFGKIHPGIRVVVRNADSEDVLEAIIQGEQEIGIIGMQPQRGNLAVEELWRDRLILAVPGDHPWAAKGSVSREELREEPFVIREKGSGTRNILERHLRERQAPDLSRFRIVAELGSSEAVKEAILAGVGCSLLSIHAVRREIEQGLIREVGVEDWRIERFFYGIYRRHANFLRCHHEFLEFLRRSAAPNAPVP
jgi:molybdate transport repressor ModE-like protein